MVALLAALVLTAQPANPWRDEARALMAGLKFAEAIERLEVARQVRGLDAAEEKLLLELLAYCQVAEGQREAAERTFIALLELDPAAELSRDVAAPKVAEAFEEARHKHFPGDYVRLEERASTRGTVLLRLIDPWKLVSEVVLLERRDGGEWVASVLSAPRAGEYVFPLQVAAGGQLEWYVEARGDGSEVKWSLGTRQVPRLEKGTRTEAQTVPVDPVPPRLPGKRVAGFILVGAALAAAAVATGLQVGGFNLRQSARDPLRPPGDFASTALAAEREGLAQQRWAVGFFIGAGLALSVGMVLAW